MIHLLSDSDTDATTDPDLTFESLNGVIDLTKDEEIAQSLQNEYDRQELHRKRQEEKDFRIAASLHDDDIQITGFTLPKSSPFVSTRAADWKSLHVKMDRISKKAKHGQGSSKSSPVVRSTGQPPQFTVNEAVQSSTGVASSSPSKSFANNQGSSRGTPMSQGSMMDKNYDSAKSSGKKWEDLRSRFDNLSRVPHASVNSFKEKLDVLDQMNVNSQELSDSTESDVSAIIEELKKKSRQEFVRSNENLGIKTLIPRNSVPLKSSSMVNLYPKQGVHPSMMDLNPMLRMSDGLQTDNFQPLSHLEAYNQFLKPGDMKGKMPEEGIFERPLNGLEQKEALKNLLSNAVGADEITPKEKRLKTPEGLKITLLEHQKLGLEWMLKMETGSNKGGILADDMGLGKTIQSISIILQNPSSDRKMRPTLIIAPTSLILQWKQEILERVSRDKLRVTMYYGANRIKDPKAFNNFDIILTSYGTVAGEWPKEPKKKKEKLVLPGSDSDSGEERVMRHMAGPLFRATFYRYVALFNVRIILDEAHSIKNKGTRSSKAVSELDAQFRWCLTGTPIQNGISELYSLLRFLKIRPYNDWTEWRTRIEEPFKKGRQKLALRRIQTVMTAVCLRRRKTDSLDGLPLIQLPDRNIRFENLTFSNPEKEFYDALEKRIQLKFNSYVEAGTVMKNYTNILLLLLRLRQAACHPNLVSKDFERSSQVNADESMALAQKMEKEIVDRLVAHQDLESQECPICFDSVQNGMIIQKCGHIFCYECVNAHMSLLPNQTCPSCRGVLEYSNLIPIMSFYSVFAPHKFKEKEVDVNSGSKIWKSSTKIDNLVRILKETKVNHPTDKTIVFSQFVAFLDLIEVPLKEQGLYFVRFDGSMNARERDRAVETFKNDSRINIILISLKCGSLGLNLTCANRVCLMDFWWNPAIENQAIDRAHRFGQKKTVEVCRMTVGGTVEDRILALQEKKQQIADAVLDEGGRQSTSRLGINDLMNLFNMNRELEDE